MEPRQERGLHPNTHHSLYNKRSVRMSARLLHGRNNKPCQTNGKSELRAGSPALQLHASYTSIHTVASNNCEDFCSFQRRGQVEKPMCFAQAVRLMRLDLVG